MISFRFHLVSLVAVFLALGLGVLTGTTVLNRGIVSQLENTTDRLAEQSSQLRGEVARLEAQVAEWSDFGGAIRDFIVAGRLADAEIVLVTQEGTDPVAVDAARAALELAGARVRLDLIVGLRMALSDTGDLETMARLLEMRDEDDPTALRARAAEMIADQVAFGSTSGDVIDLLAAEGFVTAERPDEEEPRPRDPDPVILVVGGGTDETPLLPEAFLVPLVERLVLDGQSVGAAEASTVEAPFVPLLRDGPVSDRIVTQDNVDQIPGEVSLVLALEDLMELGEPGHYGIKSGAGQLVPPLG